MKLFREISPVVVLLFTVLPVESLPVYSTLTTIRVGPSGLITAISTAPAGPAPGAQIPEGLVRRTSLSKDPSLDPPVIVSSPLADRRVILVGPSGTVDVSTKAVVPGATATLILDSKGNSGMSQLPSLFSGRTVLTGPSGSINAPTPSVNSDILSPGPGDPPNNLVVISGPEDTEESTDAIPLSHGPSGFSAPGWSWQGFN